MFSRSTSHWRRSFLSNSPVAQAKRLGLPSFSIYHFYSGEFLPSSFLKIGSLNPVRYIMLKLLIFFLFFHSSPIFLFQTHPLIKRPLLALCSATSPRKVSLHTKRGYSWELHKKYLSSLTGMLTGYWVFCEQSSRVLHSLHLAIHCSQTKWWRIDFHFIHTRTYKSMLLQNGTTFKGLYSYFLTSSSLILHNVLFSIACLEYLLLCGIRGTCKIDKWCPAKVDLGGSQDPPFPRHIFIRFLPVKSIQLLRVLFNLTWHVCEYDLIKVIKTINIQV